MVERRVNCPRCGSRVPESQVGPPEAVPPPRPPAPQLVWTERACAECEGRGRLLTGPVCGVCEGRGLKGFVVERIG